MLSFFKNRKRKKLHQQWTDQNGLPKEEIIQDMQKSESYKEEIGTEDEGVTNTVDSGGSSLLLRFRHLFIIGLTIVFLLIATSVLATILIIQSC